MNLKRLITQMAIVMIAVFSLAACDNEFKEVGGSIVDNNSFDALSYNESELAAHSEKIQRIQGNNLSSYALGVYDDPEYGKMKANILSRLKLSQTNPNFGKNPVLDSVVLEVPYFSTEVERGPNSSKYELDSVFGNSSIQLSLFRSNYFLREFDPTDYDDQVYYSDDIDKFEANLYDTPIYSINSFKPSKKEISVIKTGAAEDEDDDEVADTTKLSPRMRLKLPVAFWKELIMDKEDSNELLSNENFQDYFRGLYMKADADDSGVLSLMNFNSDGAGITLYFRSEIEKDEDDDDSPDYLYGSYKLEFDDQMVNVFDDEYDELPADNNNLYIKGGQGSIGIIDLFTDKEQVDSLRHTDWLINEANLKFYVNADELPANQENPQRLFLYDFKNKEVLLDYKMDESAREDDPLNSRTIHLGKLSKDDDGNAYYKIRVTNYINNIINKDSTNTRLGLVVSQNVNEAGFSKAKIDSTNTRLPRATVLARNGTVLYGPNATSDKALKLEIFYTKPNE